MPNPGALRFNTDSLKMELFDGNQWVELVATSADSQTGGARGVFSGGRNINVIDYITISTTGNAIDFGDLTEISKEGFALASSTRGIFAGNLSYGNVIEFITISSTGNAQDFGDLTVGRRSGGTCASSTRGLFGSGIVPSTPAPNYSGSNIIDYITIASVGNAIDFGDLNELRAEPAGFSSSTRGVFAGGWVGAIPSIPNTNQIDFVTISSLGNATDFGDLSASRGSTAGCSNSTRGVIAGGYNPFNTKFNVIDFIIISTLGNATDFGDLTIARDYLGSCSSSTRGVWGGGGSNPSGSGINVIDCVSINSSGNALDFGDLTTSKYIVHACSNGHGGL